MWTDDDRKWLYGQMKDRGYDVGSEETFAEDMDYDEDAEWWYEEAKSQGLDVGRDLNEFIGLMRRKQPDAAAASASSGATGSAGSTPAPSTPSPSTPSPALTGDGVQDVLDRQLAAANRRSQSQESLFDRVGSAIGNTVDRIRSQSVPAASAVKDSGPAAAEVNRDAGSAPAVPEEGQTADSGRRQSAEGGVVPPVGENSPAWQGIQGKGLFDLNEWSDRQIWFINGKQFDSTAAARMYIEQHPEMRYSFTADDGQQFKSFDELVEYQKEKNRAATEDLKQKADETDFGSFDREREATQQLMKAIDRFRQAIKSGNVSNIINLVTGDELKNWEDFRKSRRAEYDKLHYNDAVRSNMDAFFEEQAKAQKEAYRQMEQYSRNAPNSPYAGFARGTQMAKISLTEMDPQKISSDVVKSLDRRGALTNYIIGRMGLKPTEVPSDYNPLGGGGDTLTGAEMNALTMLMYHEHSDMADKIQQDIYDYYKRHDAPDGDLEYILSSAVHDNIWSQIAKALAHRVANDSGLRDQLREMAFGEYGEKAGFWTQAAATAAPFTVDLLTGGFYLPSQAGKAAVGGVVKGLSKEGAKRLVTRGASKAMAKQAAGRATARWIATEHPYWNIALNALGSGVNFMTFEAQNNAIQALGGADVSFSDFLGSAAKGFLLGGAMGFGGGFVGKMGENMRGWRRLAADAAGFGTEVGIFTASDAATQAMNGEDVDWGKSFGRSLAMVTGFKLGGLPFHAKGMIDRYTSPRFDLKFTDGEKESLQIRNRDELQVFIGEMMPVEKEGADGKKTVDRSSFDGFMGGQNSDVGTKRKVNYLLTGSPLIHWTDGKSPYPLNAWMNENEDGTYTMQTFDADGKINGIAEYTDRSEAEKDFRDTNDLCRFYNMNGIRAFFANAGVDTKIERDAFYITRYQFGIGEDGVGELEELLSMKKDIKDWTDRDREIIDAHLKNIHDVFGERLKEYQAKQAAAAYDAAAAYERAKQAAEAEAGRLLTGSNRLLTGAQSVGGEESSVGDETLNGDLEHESVSAEERARRNFGLLMADTENQRKAAEDAMRGLFGDSLMDFMLGGDSPSGWFDPILLLRQALVSGESEENIGKVVDYINAWYADRGLRDGLNGAVRSEIEKSDAEIDGMKNRQSGLVRTGVMKTDNRQVYVIDGDVEMLDDGSGIDRGKSSESLIVKDAVTGKVEVVDPRDLLSVDAGLDAEGWKEQRRKEIEAGAEGLLGAAGEDGEGSEEPGGPEEPVEPVEPGGPAPLGGGVGGPDELGGVNAVNVGANTYNPLETSGTSRSGKEYSGRYVPTYSPTDYRSGVVTYKFEGPSGARLKIQAESEEEARSWLSGATDEKNNWAALNDEDRASGVEQKLIDDLMFGVAIDKVRIRPDGSVEIEFAAEKSVGLHGEIAKVLAERLGFNITPPVDGTIERSETPLSEKVLRMPSNPKGRADLSYHTQTKTGEDGSRTTTVVPLVGNKEIDADDEKILREDYEFDLNEDSKDVTFPVPDGMEVDPGSIGEGVEIVGLKEMTEHADGGVTAKGLGSDGNVYDISLQGKGAGQVGDAVPAAPGIGEGGAVDADAMPMIGDGEDAEPDFMQTTPERGYRYLYDESGLDADEADAFVDANLAEAKKRLDAETKRKPVMGTSLSKYKREKAAYEDKVNGVQAEVDYWNGVKQAGSERAADAERARQEEERRRLEEAREAERLRQEEELRRRQEAEALGGNAVGPAIRARWDGAEKIEGNADELVLADGTRIGGRYVMVESGAATPSHNAGGGFVKNDGFPVDEQGGTVNDRDYERDRRAQDITREMGRTYDSRALQNVPVVSRDGVVLSGNGRTMAGEIAAADGTDGAYIDYLSKYGGKFGFTPEQVSGMQHPRVVFVPDEPLPYNAETFSRFNAQEMKGQNKTETAVKLGKIVPDDVFNRIIRGINEKESISDFFGDDKASAAAVNELRSAGVINEMQYGEMFDGGRLSGSGRELIENVLIGKAFSGSPDAVRMLTEFPAMRQKVVSALTAIGNNRRLGADYTLENELMQAVDLAYNALKSGAYKYGDRVSDYARQQNLFSFDDGATVADYKNMTVMMLADVLNNREVNKLRNVLEIYNAHSAESAAGQMDMFSDGVRSKEEILKDVFNILGYGTKKEIESERRDAHASVRSRLDGEGPGGPGGGVEGSEPSGSAGSVDTGGAVGPVGESGAEPAPVEAEPTQPIKTTEWNGHKVGDRYLSPNGDGETAEIIGFDYTYAGENGMPEVLLRGYDKDGNLLGTEAVPPLVFEDNVRDLQKLEAEPNAVQAALAAAERETNTEPTEAQKEAGNYKKGHVKIDGYDVTIENPKGSVRRGTDASGKQWEQEMQNTYGYIRGTEGVDGDHIDVFFSEDPSQGDVFVVDQVNKDGSFDEHKVMYGFPDIESARKAYLSNYEDGWQGLGAITPVSKEEFKKWIRSSHRKTKPFAEYSSVKPLGDTQLGDQPTAGYSIEPTTYTNKKGKTTPMHLVTFSRELSKDEIRAGKELAKESRGWWDREKGGFMMRDEDSAKALADALSNEEAVQDAQPLSVADVATVTDQADMKAVDETIKVEREPQTTPQYDYDREDDVYDKTLTGLRNVLNDRKRGAIPNIKSIENIIRDLRKRAKTIEDGMATAAGETIPQAFDALANLNGKRRAYEQFLSDIRKKMAETERDGALAAHGVKLGDKIMYKGKEATIHDADARQVTLDVGLAPVLYEVTDWENVELPKPSEPTEPSEPVSGREEPSGGGPGGETPGAGETGGRKSKSKWVDDEDAARFEELRQRLRKKMGGQLNMGIDPEIFAMGAEMAYMMIKHGLHKFADFAREMIDAVGEEIRPYLKSLYEGARNFPETEEYLDKMTPYDEVRKFDVKNFDKKGAKDIVATAEHIVREQAAEREAKEATDKLKQERNEQRKETEQEVAANTEALASEAATVASEIESKLPSARSEREVNDLAKNIDNAIDKVNDQLALLGYYEAEPVESDFNEAYGYMRNAEKKAVKNVTELFKTLTKELGISDPVVYDTKGKKQKSVTANIAPAGGDVTMRFMLNRDKGVELYIDFMLAPDYENNRDNLVLKSIMFRPEKNLPNGGRDYLRANNFFPVDVTVPQMLHGIRSVCQEWLPAEDYVAMAQRVAAENAGNQKEKTSKGGKSKKKSVSLQQQTIPDLFSGLFGEEDSNLKPTSNEQEVHVQPRTGTSEREGGHQREQNEPLGESKQNEDERPDAGGVVRRSGNDTKSDTAGGSRVSEPSDGKRNLKPAKPEPAPLAESERKNTHNNHAERGTDYAPKGTSARIEANIKAIETMQRLIESGEPATPEDMSVLRKFSGWGGLGAAFKEKVSSGDSGYNSRLRDDYQPANPINARLRELLSPEAYEAANMSRNTAYYTPAPIIDAMWDVARAMGFRGGNVLEGSAGIGKVLGQMPTDMSERSNIQAIEVDETTGNILKLLYPDAKVDVQGFEKTYIPNGSVDLAITNVPFGDILVKDETGDKDLSKKFHSIHDFCIAKNVRKLKEGGVGIFISTSGTLDSPNSAKLRNWLVNEGNSDVVGAFRMHKDTFGGAGVTSDIIVVRKRVNGRKSANAIDVSGTLPIRTVKYNTGETKRGSSEVIIKDLALDVNKHFVEHPEDMAGEMAFAFEKGNTYRATSKALYPSPSINQEQRLSEWAQQFKDMDWDKAEERESQQVVYEDLGEDVKEGSMLLDREGNLCLAQRGKAVPINVNSNKVKGHTKAECFNAYKAIKDALADVLEYQTTHSDDSGLQQRLAKLNKAYDSFVKTYGHLNKNTSISFLRSDMDYPSIAALESVSETGDKSGKRIVTYGKTDIFSRRVVETESEPKPTTIKDGIIASIYLNGRVDVPYIAEQLNMSDSDVRQQIIESGLGFENPTTTEMEVSYEYLSGNVREKLRQAQENNTDGRYDANIKALERVIPMNIPAHLIEFTLGSSWVEPKLYEDFVKERTGLDVKLTNAGGTWIMTEPYWTNTEQNKAMGVISEKCDKTIYGHELIKAAITCKSISVTKTVSTGYGSNKTTETIVDKEATMACANKIDEIRQDFKDWARGKMQGDPEMSERMERVYNELFNNSVPKEIPDEFVPEHFGGAATVVNGKPFKLRPHQAKAVIRATTQPLMLAHEVGTGKTYTLISTAMEMRRLGTARKPMIVVQNATVGQFVASAKALYPNAKILTLEDADRNAEGRRNFYAKIRYNDWDMIVVPQSVFERIPDSEERQIRFVEDKVEEKMMVLEKMREAAADDRDPVLRQAQRELDQLNDELNDLKLALQERKAGGKTEKDEKREAKTRQNAMVKAQEMLDRETDDVANFDDMGIDALLIDEAHEYKHLGFATAMQRGVKGVDPSYSKKSQGVYLKTQAVLESKNGKNVVFATGTPISNTAAEIWTFMRYLMPADTMREYGIYYFDDFVRNFGNIQQMLEFSTNGKYKENNRFAGYVNLPELVRIWAGVADTVLTREAGGVSDKIPKMDGAKAQDIYLPQTKALRGVMKFVKDQLDDYEKMSGKEKKENSHIPLVMYGIAKAAAVDARLVLEDAADEPNSKTNEAVRQTLRSLEDTKEYNGTVAIFADNYQNKATGFNLYEDIRKKLIDAGVPEAQVVVMKSGMSIKKKLEIFDKVNRGEVRVIMGSTFTLGTGVNIQERLHTLIHVDAPNRPMDYTQRNGRILRQGNLHNEWGIPVRVLRFGVEDSLDVTAYQRLKTKGAIADSIMEGKKMMSNSMENRVLEEEQDLFGDITAQLSGSQYALLKNQVEKEVKKLEARKKQWEADQTYVHNQKPRLKALIKDSEERAKRNKEALAKVESAKNDGITIGKMKFPSLDAMGDYIKDYNSKQREQQEQVRTASGYKAEAKSDLTVSVGGFDFHIHRVISKEQKQEKGQLSLSFFSKTQMTYSCPELGLEDVPVDGQRLKSAMEDIVSNVMTGNDFREKAEYAERAAERYKGELQQVEARDGKPFEYADELKQAKEKLAEYEELMKAEMAEKEAKYAEMDASVEAANVRLVDEDEESEADLQFSDGDDWDGGEDVEAINQQFNDDLDKYERGELPSGFRFEMGLPSAYLQSAGFDNLPISMRASLLSRKAGAEKHPFDASDLKDLVNAIQKPIAILHYTNAKTRNLIVDVLHNRKHFLIGVTLNYDANGIEINSVSGLFPKDNHEWIKWIQDGKAIRIDQKEKVLDLIDSLRTNPAESDRIGLDLNRAAKIVKEFENPKLPGENISEGEIKFSMREEPAPKVTKKGYAVYVVKTGRDGRVKAMVPKMLQNDPGAPPMTWLNADTGYLKRGEGGAPLQNTLGRGMVSVNGKQSGGKKSNKLSWRPGKHLAAYPNASQFATATGEIPENVVFFEVEYAADPDLHREYQLSAWEHGMKENGDYDNTLGGIPYIPRDSYYVYRTNGIADGATPMIITGAYKINRALTDAEARKLNEEAGGKWFPRRGGELTAEDLARMGLDKAGLSRMRDEFDYDKIAVGHDESDDARSLPGYVRRDLDFSNKNLVHAAEENAAVMGKDGIPLERYKDGYLPPEERGDERPSGDSADDVRSAIEETASTFGEDVELIEDVSEIKNSDKRLEQRMRNAKGWFNAKTGKVTIVVPNNRSVEEAVGTVLHEVTGHKGLRELFGDDFDTFLDNIYNNVEDDIRERIDRLNKKKGGDKDRRDATEEYMSRLAEDGKEFEELKRRGVWQKIKDWFMDLLRKVGVKLKRPLNDNDLRYIIWRSRERMKERAQRKSGKMGADPMMEARDAAVRDELGIDKERRQEDEKINSDSSESLLASPEQESENLVEISNLKQRYKGVPVHPVTLSAGVEGLMSQPWWDNESYDEDDAKELLFEFYEGAFKTSLGITIEGNDGFIIFADKKSKKYSIENTYFHESVHHFFEKTFEDGEGRDICKRFWDANSGIRNSKELIESIKKNYDESDWAEEFFAFRLAAAMEKGDFSKVIPYLNTEDIEFLDELLKSINYDREKECSERQSGRNSGSPDLRETGHGLYPLQSKGEVSRGDTDGNERVARESADEDESGLKFSDGGDVGDAESVERELNGYDAGRMTFEDAVTDGLTKLSAKNKDDKRLRVEAIMAIGGNLSKILQGMSAQREYDRKTVDDIVRLARTVIGNGMFRGFSPYEVGRLLGMVKRAAGREDITKQADEVVDLLMDRQLKELSGLLDKQLSVRGKKVDGRGVEIQGALDAEGQRMMDALRGGMKLEADDLDARIDDCLDRMGSDDDVTRHNAEQEYAGLMLANEYREKIGQSVSEEENLRNEIRQADDERRQKKASGDKDADRDFREFKRETENAIRENKLQRMAAYGEFITKLGGELAESAGRAKDWLEQEQQRVREIQHNANSDLEGKSASEFSRETWRQRAANWAPVRFFMKPLGTFDTMLRFFGSKSVDGRGYLWNRFMTGWVEANDKEWRNLRAAHDVLDEKVSEVFGKKMRWSDLFSLERKMEGMEVEFWDAGEKKTHKLSQGNMLYIYMVNKMSDGRMKLRKMGISEEDVERITDRIDPRFIELADWMQEDFLKQKRKDYNAVHLRLTGADMADIENYFPLKVNKRSLNKDEDLGSGEVEAKPSTKSVSWIKRTKNSRPLDIVNADAFDVILEHLQDNEHIAAFAELNRDLNTLLSYRRFRNKVLNMSSLRFGSGKSLWNNFRRVCEIAAGVYTPKVDRDSVDTTIVNIAKGVTMGKISFRIYTAFKQLTSSPAFTTEASAGAIVKNNPLTGGWQAWNWAMKNLPGFSKRWQSRQAGDSRLIDTDSDWKLWHKKFVRTMSRYGMTPNALIDALTVACGAKAIYDTKVKKYKKMGYDDARAHKLALRDASISVNETQQSSEEAYLSAVQLDRTVASTAITVFRNASMGYQRRYMDAMANFGRKFRPGYRDESIAFMKKQLMRDGLSEEQADAAAKSAYRRSWWKDVANMAVFGHIMQIAWNIAPYLPFLFLIGGDEDKKKEMAEDALLHSLAGPIEGLSFGAQMSEIFNMVRSGNANKQGLKNYQFNLLPLMSDLQTMMRHFTSDQVQGWNDVVNLVVQSGVGVNPQTITDMVGAILDRCDGDPDLSREATIMWLRIANAPQTQLDQVYLEELGLKGSEAKKLSAGELAERYVRYKMRRTTPLTGWAYSDEARQKAEDRYMDRFVKLMDERIEGLDEEQMQQNFDGGDALLRKEIGKRYAKQQGTQDYGGSPKTTYGEIYNRHRNYFDLAEDVLLQTEAKKAKDSGDTDRYKEIDSGRKSLTKLKKDLDGAPYTLQDGRVISVDDIMNEIREERLLLLEELGL